MFALKRLMPAASLLTLCALAACSDSTSPANVDPQAIESGLSTSTSTFQNNAAFQSVSLLANHFPQFAAASLAGATLARVGHLGGLRPGPAARATLRFTASLTSNPQALFPANVLGQTLEWDTTTNAYVIGTAPGAPANGMRLVLYLTNPATGLPFRPLSVLGFLELTDKSTPQADKLGVLLTFGPATTIASYDITVVRSTSTVSARALGYIRSATGSSRVDFDLNDVASSVTQTLVSTNDLTGDDGTRIHVEMTIGQTTDALLARVSRDNATIELNAAGDILGGIGPLSGTVKFNGTSVATLGGTASSPTLTGIGGHSFTAAQTQSILIIFVGAVDVVFGVSDGVFAPGTMVFHN